MSFSKIVVGTDFSDASDLALDYALALAKEQKADVFIVHTYGIPAYNLPSGFVLPSPEVAANLSNVAQQALDRSLEHAKTKWERCSAILRDGDPRDEIAKIATEVGAGLIVIGTHGRSGWRRWVMGSVADRIVRTSHLPVLVVPAPASHE